MKTKELIVAELLKDGKISAEDAAVLLQKEYITVSVPVVVRPINNPTPWYLDTPYKVTCQVN